MNGDEIAAVLKAHRPRYVTGTRMVVCACEDRDDRSKRVSLAQHERHVAAQIVGKP